uniref:Protein kinase domain-containing protein n=1 Tax=Zooxanthella nutricula TaxID=1333877 RepID=A0A7S2KPB5_9DINO
MKKIRKQVVVNRDQAEHTRTERMVLEAVSHPFIVALHYAFQTPKNLYLVLEFCNGGELFFHLSRVPRFTEERTQFYAAETSAAIAYLHEVEIVYRDLKPENLLLDCEGHLKITDFGLSKRGIIDNVSAKTVCGTPEYIAPEIVERRGHGRAVDWYAIGALTFEMLTGLPPFYHSDREIMVQRIRRGELSYPAYMSSNAKSLLQGLLRRDPERRLGGGPTDGEEVRQHAFFETLDWVKLVQREVEPPFKPNVQSANDVRYFEKEFIKQPAVNTDVGAVGRDVLHIDGFTYDGK